MRKSLLLLTFLFAILGAKASEAGDSLARALATYWGSSVNTKAMPEPQLKAFLQGLNDYLVEKPDSSKLAYNYGAGMALNFARSIAEAKQMGLDVDFQSFAQALSKVLAGENVGFSVSQAQRFIDNAVAPEEAKQFSPESQAAFIAQAAGLPDAVVTSSGLVFQTLKDGEGDSPTPDDTVRVNYIGRLSDGTVFDSTEQPIEFKVSNLVPGFTEGLQRMQKGGTYRLFIPSDLGYGERGAGGVIPPGAALDFTVELLDILK